MIDTTTISVGSTIACIGTTQFIHTDKGTHIIYDKSTKRFVRNSWWDSESVESLLGLDKPKIRTKSLTQKNDKVQS